MAAVKAADGEGCYPVKSVAEKGSNMQRTDITEIFPDATKEQLDALMDLNGKDINNARGDLSTLQSELKKAQEALAAAAAGDKSAELQDTIGKLQAAQTELETLKAANTLRETREKVAAAKGIPINLLTGETEEACTAQADAILAFAAQNEAFALKDGGEPLGKGGTPTREQFANWAKENNI